MGVATGAYVATCIATFDACYDSALILSLALTGLLGWLYGTRTGLLAIVPLILLNTAILFLVSGKPEDLLLTCNPTGIILSVAFVLATGYMRESQKKLDQLHANLSNRMTEATDERDNLIQQLIERDESERIRIGQDLHDGVGQYLTGMLLYSEALSLKLSEASHPQTALAEKMTKRIRESMQLVRQLSRSQLPLYLAKTTLEVAVEEMVAYFREVSSAKFNLEHTGNSQDLPAGIAQHLYRITHETIFCAIQKCKAMEVDIRLVARTHNCTINIVAAKMPAPPPLPLSGLLSKVTEYRAKAIGGKLTLTTPPEGGFRLECSTVFEEEAE